MCAWLVLRQRSGQCHAQVHPVQPLGSTGSTALTPKVQQVAGVLARGPIHIARRALHGQPHIYTSASNNCTPASGVSMQGWCQGGHVHVALVVWRPCRCHCCCILASLHRLLHCCQLLIGCHSYWCAWVTGAGPPTHAAYAGLGRSSAHMG